MFNYVNDSMVIGTFNQAYKAARATGRPHAEAIKIGDQIAKRSQAVYEDVYRPAIISKSSSLGQTFLPFQTYVFNALQTLKDDVLFGALTVPQKMKAVGEMAATGMLLNMGVKGMTGRTKIDFRDIIPGIRIAEMGLSGAFLAASLPAKAAGKALKGNLKGAGSDLGQGAALFGAPVGGLQALKTFKGIKSGIKGTTEKPLRSAVFGPIKKEASKKSRKKRKSRGKR